MDALCCARERQLHVDDDAVTLVEEEEIDEVRCDCIIFNYMYCCKIASCAHRMAP